MGITMIWAMAENGVIGKDNTIPWRLPKDMAFFKQQTTGHTIIMGRKTWDSLNGKPLPNRKNVVLTRQNQTFSGAEVIHSVEEGVKMAENETLYVIGGAAVYSAFMPYADRLIVTCIKETFEGDTFMDKIDENQWKLVQEIPGEKDDKNPYDYSFKFYEKRA